MDATLFDRLTRSLSDAGTRRRLLHLLAAVTVGGALDLLLGDRGIGARGNMAGIGGNRRHKRRRHKKERKRKRHKQCAPKSKDKTCAGKCGRVRNNCQKFIDCGSCPCDPACSGTAPICVDGVCAACSEAHPCPGGCCAADGSCQPGDTTAACGPVGGACTVCTGDELCDAAHVCTAPVRCGSPGAVCRVFATSTMRRGKFGGLNGADQLCQELATTAGLPGTYMAWLSDATGSPSTRFTQAQGPYQLIDGPVVADNWIDLVSGSLGHAINRDEHGDPLSDPDGRIDVWTATTTSGTRDTSDGVTADCNNWSSSEIYYRGGLGSSSLVDNRWTVAGFASNCAIRSRLYCFQQS